MNPSMRPKVTGDTFFIPDPEGIVYFRNNKGSFRMEGSMMDRWIERLIPMFDGQHSLESLTGGLPDAHRNRVYEIADTLLQNGFVRDVSQDMPHQLTEGLLAKFASQIDFLDAFGGSGAYRFQQYRRSEVLATGSGPMLVSLVSALLESGLSRFRLLVCGDTPTDRKRIGELAAYARLTDPDVRIEELAIGTGDHVPWNEIVEPFERILYVSYEQGTSDLQSLHRACVERKKTLLPAVMFAHAGTAGPIVSPESEGDWESAMRRLHRSEIVKDPQNHAPSSVAEAMLANLLAFELFKSLTGTGVQELRDQIYLLDLETLEGSRHAFLPHPAVQDRRKGPIRGLIFPPSAETDSAVVESNELFTGFTRLTSPVTGVFHCWDEGEYIQLPLSVCRVQAADPLSEGPALLLPEIVCGGFTHEQARREAGLAGIESYAARLHREHPHMGIGTGASASEGIVRGLYRCLQARLGNGIRDTRPEGLKTYDGQVEGARHGFYLTSLTIMREKPEVYAGQEICGFPVSWIRCGKAWYGAVGFSREAALQTALSLAVLSIQTEANQPAAAVLNPALEETWDGELLSASIRSLNARGIRAAVYDLAVEPFMKENVAGVFGVVLREEVSP